MDNRKETAEERFKRLATKRTNVILNDLRVLGNLSNKVNYSYSEEDVEKIFTAIYEMIRDLEEKFSVKEERESFEL